MTDNGPTLTRLTADIVCSYVAHNAVPTAGVPDLIRAVHGTLSRIQSGAAVTEQPKSATDPVPAAAVKRSITDAALISFIDGRPYKTLRRHLSANGMTPEQYRSHYGLPAEYPLVAPSYSRERSKLAKAIGLGVPGALAKAA